MPRVSAIAAFVVDVQNQQNHIAHFKELVTVKVAVELIMIVKRTQICMTWNGPFDSEDEHVSLSANINFRQIHCSWLSGILATEVMVLCLACFENQGQQKL